MKCLGLVVVLVVVFVVRSLRAGRAAPASTPAARLGDADSLKQLYAEVTTRAEPAGTVFSIVRPGLVSPFAAELMFEQRPEVDAARLQQILTAAGLRTGFANDVVYVEFPRYRIELGGEVVPARVMLEPAPFRFEGGSALAFEPTSRSSQSPEAQAARGWPWGVRCHDLNAGLPAKQRFELVCEVVRLLASALAPQGLHWRESGRIVAGAELQAVLADPVAATLSFICLRQVRVDNAPGEMLFDTKGLAGLALPEVQMHFRDLAPELATQCVVAVAGMAIDRGLFANNGDLLKQVPGVPDLRLHYEQGLRQTNKVVLDLDPGAPYSAGKRP